MSTRNCSLWTVVSALSQTGLQLYDAGTKRKILATQTDHVASSVSDQSQAWPSYMPNLVVEIDLHQVGHSAVRANGPFRVSVASNRCTMFRLLLTVATVTVTPTC